MNNKKNMDNLKEEYHDMKMPDELDDYINKGLNRGRDKMKKDKNNIFKKFSVGVAAALLMFTVSVNTIPGFASTMNEVPLLGNLVNILNITDSEVEGGVITDGTDISYIGLIEEDDADYIVINFEDEEDQQAFVNSFKVDHTEYPNTLTFNIGGARRFSAMEYFDDINKSDKIENVYNLITLDDSLIRFSITLKDNYDITIKEYENPGHMVVKIKDSEEDSEESSIYSLRSKSYEFGEQIGHIEESIFEIDSRRMLLDSDGKYFIEANYYNTLEEAEEAKQNLKEDFPAIEDFIIEERTNKDIPSNY